MKDEYILIVSTPLTCFYPLQYSDSIYRKDGEQVPAQWPHVISETLKFKHLRIFNPPVVLITISRIFYLYAA